MPFLCPSCEMRFSAWEGAFAKTVFHPVHRDNRTDFDYSKWLLKFAVSLSWRALAYLRHQYGADLKLPYGHEAHVDPALEAWRSFLMDDSPHPGRFEQHLVIGDTETFSAMMPMTFELSVFIETGVTFETAHSEKETYIFIKMGRIIICGIIYNEAMRWAGTKIHVKNGRYFPTTFTISGRLPAFLKSGADRLRDAREKLAAPQNDKILQAYIKKHGAPPG